MTITKIEASNSLADLAGRINASHRAAETAEQKALDGMIRCGRDLLEARARVEGDWWQWHSEQFTHDRHEAELMMELAENPHSSELRERALTYMKWLHGRPDALDVL